VIRQRSSPRAGVVTFLVATANMRRGGLTTPFNEGPSGRYAASVIRGREQRPDEPPRAPCAPLGSKSAARDGGQTAE
jgi:hypothetical protein